MKAYTDIEQSKKLAEILPIESADIHYERVYFEGKQSDWFVKLGSPIKSDDIIPCLSLATLLEYMNRNFYNISLNYCGSEYTISFDDSERYKTITKDYSIDAAFEMIVWLKENRKI